jgi:hypothetical protein
MQEVGQPNLLLFVHIQKKLKGSTHSKLMKED